MAIPILKKDSILAVKVEGTEGVYAAPSSATDGYFQPKPGFELSMNKEALERDPVTGALNKLTPVNGVRTPTGTIPVECKGSGTEGVAPKYSPFLQSLLGATRTRAARITTKTGNTSSVLQIEDADIASCNVGDGLVILKAGEHHACAIVSKTSGAGTATITVTPAHPSTVPNNVQISKSATFLSANSGHPSLSISEYPGNQVTEKVIGARCVSAVLENFLTGQIASWTFGLEGMDFDHLDGGAPHTPTFDTGQVPVILDADIYVDGTKVDMESMNLSLTQAVTWLTSTASAVGRIAGRPTEKRDIQVTLVPWSDDTTVTNYTKFVNGTEISLVARAYVPSGVAGEFQMGTVVIIYIPALYIKTFKKVDKNGVYVDQLECMATGGVIGANLDCYITFV